MQVENVEVVEGTQQALTHAAEGRVIEIAVVGDHADNAASGLLDFPLGVAQELDVVILQPLRVFLAQGLAVHLLVIVNQAAYPVSLVAGVP